MKKLAIITTHPIQYNAPFFKLLTQRGKVQLKVFYTWPQAIEGFDDPDFGKQIKWDIPLLDGYDWEAITNVSKKPSSKNWRGINCPTLIEQVEAFGPAAVMVYGWNLKSHFKALRYFKGRLPVWFFGDSTLLDEQDRLKKILRRAWLTFVYRYIDKAFYVGTNNRSYFRAHGLKEGQLVFFPHAVDNEYFFDNEERQYEQKARRWREKLGYTADDKIILFAGKLESKKNPLILLEAVSQINKSTNQQINLLFVGNGPLENELKMKSKDLAYVKFLPFQNQLNMPVIYRLGNVYCLPSQGPGETWGLAVNEALACGKPVILSDKVGCAVDLVQEDINGLIFNGNSLSDLVLKLKNGNFLDKVKGNDYIANSVHEWGFEQKASSIEIELNHLG